LKQEGDTETGKQVRQERVYRLLIRGLTIREIAKQEGVGERTIQRDVQGIKFSLMQIIQSQQLRTHRLALAELEEIWRELWTLYHRAPRDIPRQQDGKIVMTREDDRPIKATLLMALMRVSGEKNYLVFQIPAPPAQPNVQSSRQAPERVIADFIDTLPEQLRKSVLDVLEQRTGTSEKDS
jgi:hypothetical protein